MRCSVSPSSRAAAIRLARPWWASHSAATPAVRATAKLVPWPWRTAGPVGLVQHGGADHVLPRRRDVDRRAVTTALPGQAVDVGPADRDALVVAGRPQTTSRRSFRRRRARSRPPATARRTALASANDGSPAQAHRDHLGAVVDGPVDRLGHGHLPDPHHALDGPDRHVPRPPGAAPNTVSDSGEIEHARRAGAVALVAQVVHRIGGVGAVVEHVTAAAPG